MNGYSVSIASTSRELSAKERIQLKDTTEATRLDKATQQGEVIIDPDFWAELNIHNEHATSGDTDYKNYIIADKSGERFVTGSESLWSAFQNIVTELEGTDEAYKIKVYRMPSKNRQGKDFLTCSVI